MNSFVFHRLFRCTFTQARVCMGSLYNNCVRYRVVAHAACLKVPAYLCSLALGNVSIRTLDFLRNL